MSKPSRVKIIQSLYWEFSCTPAQIGEWLGVSRQYAHRKARAGDYECYADTSWASRPEIERLESNKVAWQIIAEEEVDPQDRKVRNSYKYTERYMNGKKTG